MRFAAALVLVGGLWGCERGDFGAGGEPLVFGRTGQGLGEFSYPRAALFSDDGVIWIVDKSARIQAFDTSGHGLRMWETPASDVGKPTGLGLDRNGRILIADTHYYRILVYTTAGQLLESHGAFGRGPGEFLLVTDAEVDNAGNTYVSEYGGNDRISKFDKNWNYLFSFGHATAGQARLSRPQSIIVDDDNSIWVTDACNHRICHFSTRGELLATIGHEGHGVGELRYPYGMTQLSDGSLVVAEFGNNRVQRFDRSGASFGTWGSAGRRVGQLAYPWAVAADDDDRIFIVDSGNNRVQVIDGARRATWSQTD